MTKPLSNDLRERLVSAVDSGLSRRSAARRFGVAASTAIKWVDRWRRTGHVRPRPQGGDKRSHRIEAYWQEILALVEEVPDITLAEIAASQSNMPDAITAWQRQLNSRPSEDAPYPRSRPREGLVCNVGRDPGARVETHGLGPHLSADGARDPHRLGHSRAVDLPLFPDGEQAGQDNASVPLV